MDDEDTQPHIDPQPDPGPPVPPPSNGSGPSRSRPGPQRPQVRSGLAQKRNPALATAGAFAVGLRYGSGVMHHKIEGDQTVYWTGPTLGFDIGGNASKEFILVYNLYDSQDLYHRFPAAEGTAYFVGGFTASYLRRGDIVLIPIRLGVGLRLGANVGYMKFSSQSKLMPF